MVDKVFGEQAPPTNATVDEKTLAALKSMAENARQVVVSINSELLPAPIELATPAESLDIMLHKSSDFRSGAGLENAAAALRVTKSVILTMQNGGTPADDELYVKLVAREKAQSAAHEKLIDKAPSCGMKRETLLTIKQEFVRQMTKEADGRKAGATKAADRAIERQRLAHLNLAAAQALVDEVTETRKLLSDGHRERGDRKHAHCLEVVELINARLASMSTDDVVFVDAMEDDAPQTAAETERDEANRCNDLLTLQLQQFQAQAAAFVAASAAEMTSAPPADPYADLLLDFPAERDQLPSLGTPDPIQLRSMQQMAAIFAAIPWGTQAPALQFSSLDVAPSFAHSLVGDAIWAACWQDRKDHIGSSHWIPVKLLNILMHIVRQEDGTMDVQMLETGKKRYAEVESNARSHRRVGPHVRAGQ
jgi:hypothetical protein